MRIHKVSPYIAGGAHVGKDDHDIGAGDQGILLGYVGEETGDTDVRSLMVRLDAVDETGITDELNHGAVIAVLRTSGSGVEAVQCEDLGFSCGSLEARSRSIHCGVFSTRVRAV